MSSLTSAVRPPAPQRHALPVSLAIALLLFLSTFAAVPVEAQAVNLLTKDQQTFTSSIDGWTMHGNTTVAHTKSVGRSGAGALKVTVDRNGRWPDNTRTARAGTLYKTDGIPVIAGHEYEGSWHIMPERRTSPVRCELRFYDHRGAEVDTIQGDFVNEVAGDWTKVACDGDAPAGSRYVTLRVFIADASYGDVHYVDDAALYDLTATPRPEPEPEPDPEEEQELEASDDDKAGDEAAVAAPAFVYSRSGDRSGLQPLDGATVDGDIYVQLEDSGLPIVEVEFAVDGEAVLTERHPPFDLTGSTATAPFAPNPWKTAELAEGTHQLTATVTLVDGQRLESTAIVVVDNAPDLYPQGPELLFTTKNDRSALRPLDGATVAGNIYVELAPTDLPVTRVDFVINGKVVTVERTAPFDLMGSEPKAPFTPNPWNTAALPVGRQEVHAISVLADGRVLQSSAALVVEHVVVDPEPDPQPEPDPEPNPDPEPDPEPSPDPDPDPVPAGTMGPTGKNWPSNTPAYTTPATIKINSLSELNSALAKAKSGDVIEVKPQTYSGLNVTSGNSSWSKNVLVRPPLGQRQSVVLNGQNYIRAPKVTLAGFTINGTMRADRADRSNWARIVMTANSSGYIDSSVDFGLYEIVAPDFGLGSDRLQIRGSNGVDSVRNVVVGSYLKGKYRKIGASDHNDTIQTFGTNGGAVRDLTLANSVFWASADKAFQMGNNYGLTMRNSYFGECSTNPERPPSGYQCFGYHAITGGGVGIEMYDSIVSGSINSTPTPWDVVQNVKAASINLQPKRSSGNTIDSSFAPRPPALPDLDKIWD